MTYKSKLLIMQVLLDLFPPLEAEGIAGLALYMYCTPLRILYTYRVLQVTSGLLFVLCDLLLLLQQSQLSSSCTTPSIPILKSLPLFWTSSVK